MSELKLVYSTRANVKKKSRKKSSTSPISLPSSQLLSWKLQRLHDERPAAAEVIERLVDAMLARIDSGQPKLF